MIGSMLSTMATAQKLSIQQIQKGVQDGTIPSYIGVPLIEQKTKQMQQAAASLQGQQSRNQPPIAEQVMQAADQVTRPENPLAPTSLATDRQRPAPSRGIDAAQSNMPEQYAGGGIIAFNGEDGSQVQDPYESYEGEAITPGEEGSWRSILSKFELPHRVNRAQDFGPSQRPQDPAQNFGPALHPVQPTKAQPPAAPAGPAAPPASPDISITRGPQAAPPSAAPQTPQGSAFSGIEDLYKSYLDRGRTDRDELKDLILGQKKDRAQEERDNTSMALMKAGFGMMAGRSPWALTNIGEGAQLGAESYGKGIEQLHAGDRQIVQQLASLGLKGQELDQAALKMGIDLTQHKAMEPYYQSAAEENRARAGLYPAQAGLYGAQTGLTRANEAQTLTETSLLPIKTEIDKIKAYAQSHKAAGYKPPSDKYISTIQEQAEAAMADPINSGLPLSQEAIIALTKTPKGSTSYNNALREVQQLALERARFKMAQRGMWAGQGSGGGIEEED